MRKSEVQMYAAPYQRPMRPAINVKVYGPSHLDAIMAKFKCDAETAEQAQNFSFESQQQQFWEQARELAGEIFGDGVKVYSEGRSGGWLVVHGLPDVESWGAPSLAKWSKFARLIAQDIAWRTSLETVLDDIESNEWAKPGAEAYNFVDVKGETRCIADLKAEAIAAGFGAVVRN